MHEPDDVDDFGWVTGVAKIYRRIVKKHGGENGLQRSDAIDSARREIKARIADGTLIPPPIDDLAINAELLKVDVRDQNATDKALRTLASGQASLGLENDPILDMTVTLGKGLRKVYRYINGEDLFHMDEQRHRNVESVEDAYNKQWRPVYRAWRPILQRHATLGDAIAAGDVPPGFED